MKEKLVDLWRSTYSYAIPTLCIIFIVIAQLLKRLELTDMCKDVLYKDMLSAIITFLSIVISVFGFLIPSLITAKNDKMVEYFIKNADISAFSKKIKNVVLSGIFEVLITASLFIYDMYKGMILRVVLLIWIWILAYFACSTYRFISIMVGLLLTKKEDVKKEVSHQISEESEDLLKKKLRHN